MTDSRVPRTDVGDSRSRTRPPTKPGCPDENELVLLADGALEDARRAAIDHHLDGCATCSRLVAELAGMAAPVRPAPSRYKIIRQLGAGAMGVVWEAEDTHLGRRVALKFVRADATSDRTADRERRARLFREARALAQLRHPNVVTVYDVGEVEVGGEGTELFLALELVIGTDARTWRAARPRTRGEILDVWRNAAAGIAAVHRAGIVHRDIKPDNILVADDGRVLVGDFGLATSDVAQTVRGGPEGASALTVTGAIVGTPLYMAHEQLLGEPASQQSDQYALCVSIWEALLGVRPFTGPTLGAIAMAMSQAPTLPGAPHADERPVLEVLARGLDPDPDQRWPDVDALIAALDAALLAPAPRRRRAARSRSLWLALGAAGLAAAATVGVLAWREHAAGSRMVGDPTLASREAPSGPPSAAASAGLPTTATTSSPTGASLASGIDRSPATREASGSSSPATGEASGSPATREASGSPANREAGSSSRHGGRESTGVSSRGGASTGGASTGGSSTSGSSTGASSTGDVARHAGATAPRDADGAPRSDWRLALDRATDKLGFGDGAGCLQLLANVTPPPREAEQAEDLRARCMMKAGDCAAGRAALDALGKASGWGADRLTAELENADFMYCPLDAPPRSAWPARARFRLQYASGTKVSCKPVLAFMRKHSIQLPDLREELLLETACQVNERDCAGARATYRKVFTLDETDPARIAQAQAQADSAFAANFSQCP